MDPWGPVLAGKWAEDEGPVRVGALGARGEGFLGPRVSLQSEPQRRSGLEPVGLKSGTVVRLMVAHMAHQA